MPERLTRRRRAMFANRQRVAGKGRDVALAAEPFVSLDVVAQCSLPQRCAVVVAAGD